MRRRQLWILVALGIAVAAILALAASLAQVEFSPGEPFAFGTGMTMRPPPAGMSPDLPPLVRLLLRGLLLLTLALLPFSIFYLIISPEARRRVLQNVIVFGVFLGLIYLLRQQMRFGEQENDFLAGLGMRDLAEGAAARTPAEFNAVAPQWLVILVSFVLAAFVAALSLGLIWAFLNRRRQPEPPDLLVELAEKAEEAREEIEAGGDLRHTVIRCYVEMSRIVRESRGVQRERGATPHEFEEQLRRAGLPGEPVHDLTQLFEEVRYGAKELGPWEGRRAVACLTTIADACRSLAAETTGRAVSLPVGAGRP